MSDSSDIQIAQAKRISSWLGKNSDGSEILRDAASGSVPQAEVARNWDEQCKATNVIGTVTWHCQWKVHNDDSHYFGNPTGIDEPKHSGTPQAEPPKEEK